MKNKAKHLLKFNNWTYRGGTCIIFPVNFCKMPSISSCVIWSAKSEQQEQKSDTKTTTEVHVLFAQHQKLWKFITIFSDKSIYYSVCFISKSYLVKMNKLHIHEVKGEGSLILSNIKIKFPSLPFIFSNKNDSII